MSIRQLLQSLSEPFTAELLFDRMPDCVFFIKDQESRYLCVNETLVARCRMNDKSELIGRRATQVFGEELGREFENQDRDVIRTGHSLLDKLELHFYQPRILGWCLTSKFPLKDSTGETQGLVGISRDLVVPNTDNEDYRQVCNSLDFATENLSLPPTVPQLAEIASMSEYQLDRRMKRLFGISTGQWLLKARLDKASRMLLETKLSVTEIALESGYSDHSAFTRQFRRTTGSSPSEFRASVRNSQRARKD